MRALAACLLLLGTTSAGSLTPPLQHVLQASKQASSDWASSLRAMQEKVKPIAGDARTVWDEVAATFPDAVEKATSASSPKKHTRRPDHSWDHIVRGADPQSIQVESEHGEGGREVDGNIEAYDLRTKKVDPSVLGVDPGVKQYSGYLDDNENDKHLFYCCEPLILCCQARLIVETLGFFESRNDPKNDPVILWLNGGPGCSSLTGLFLELGPSSVDEQLRLVHNPYSWNTNASVIFLDQPVNVGFSYSGESCTNTIAASKDVYALLTLFFKQFPEYAQQNFHIAGESYAGHYIPVFADEILRHKKRNINLKSILIGNGLVDGLTQYAAFRPMACGEGGWPAVLDESQCRAMDSATSRCQSLIQSCYNTESVFICVPASIYCNNALIGPYQQTGQNVYDVREQCRDSSNLCYPELGWISKWLNQPQVREALGVEVDVYEGCNFNINRDFLLHGDWMKPYHRLIPSILEQIPVLVYAVSFLGSVRHEQALFIAAISPLIGLMFTRATPITSATGSGTTLGPKRSIGMGRSHSMRLSLAV